MYILEEYLSTKTEKQVVNLLKTRARKDTEALEVLDKYNRYPYNEIPKYVTKVNNARETLKDNMEWVTAASYCFSQELWETLIGESFGYLEGFTQKELQE